MVGKHEWQDRYSLRCKACGHEVIDRSPSQLPTHCAACIATERASRPVDYVVPSRRRKVPRFVFAPGDKLGGLTVVEQLWRTVRLQCECGKVIERTAGRLANDLETYRGVSARCGVDCPLRTVDYETRWISAHQRTISSGWSTIRSGAKARSLEVSITKEQYAALRHEKSRCYYCDGEPPYSGSGLDRLDSSIGYVVGNLVVCCTMCNIAKGHLLSGDEFKAAMRVRLAVTNGDAWSTATRNPISGLVRGVPQLVPYARRKR